MSIYLCVKIHTKTNLKYFCKTVKRNPYAYLGSGVHWKRHIKYHGKQFVKTLKVWQFDDLDEATKFALKFSKDNNIVSSSKWANMQEENAIDGWVPGQKRPNILGENNPAKREEVRILLSKNNPMKRPEVAKKLSESLRGIPKPLFRGENNNSCKPEARRKISETLKGVPRKTIECPHCGKVGGTGNMKRYHFEFCKNKKVA